MTSAITVVRDVANVVFFIAMSTVTVLSYLHARKTLFAPIRTETFKLQLKVLEQLLAFFQDKTETDFQSFLDLPRIVSLNSFQMADAYASRFFQGDLEVDREKRVKRYKLLVGAVVSLKHAEKYFKDIDPAIQEAKPVSKDSQVTNPAVILAKWQKYEHDAVGFTREYSDRVKELNRLATSPILPRELRELIVNFERACRDNLGLIGEAITECAREMPEHFTSASDMKNFSPHWVWNRFNARSVRFEPLAKDILEHVNTYLKVEDIMK